MAGQIVSAVGIMIAGVFACAAYYWLSDRLLNMALPVRGRDIMTASRNLNRRAVIRPWLFLGPALLLLAVYLVYPVIATLILSFYDRAGTTFVGFDNYRWALFDREFRQSIFNNVLWLAVVPAACTSLGLVIAVLTDRRCCGPTRTPSWTTSSGDASRRLDCQGSDTTMRRPHSFASLYCRCK